MVRLTPLDELRALFTSDSPDYSRMRRLAIIITLQMTDRAAAAALHQDIEAATSLYEVDRDAGWLALEFIDFP